MEIRPTSIPGCLELLPPLRSDARGWFLKIFNRNLFAQHGMATQYAEDYCTLSHPGVIRGMHFQTPPHQHDKLVCCLSGSVFDVILDLRRGSRTFGQHTHLELSAARANMVYIPAGLAHGFCCVDVPSLLLYKVTSVYSPTCDAGVRWDSAGIAWPISQPIISARDVALPPLSVFSTPFTYVQKGAL